MKKITILAKIKIRNYKFVIFYFKKMRGGGKEELNRC